MLYAWLGREPEAEVEGDRLDLRINIRCCSLGWEIYFQAPLTILIHGASMHHACDPPQAHIHEQTIHSELSRYDILKQELAYGHCKPLVDFCMDGKSDEQYRRWSLSNLIGAPFAWIASTNIRKLSEANQCWSKRWHMMLVNVSIIQEYGHPVECQAKLSNCMSNVLHRIPVSARVGVPLKGNTESLQAIHLGSVG